MIVIVLQDPNNASNPTSLEGAIAANNAAITAAFTDALSRTDPDNNYMHTDLDLNGYRILNSGPSESAHDLVRRIDLSEIEAGEFRKNVTTLALEYRPPGETAWTVLYTEADLKGPAGAGNGDLEAVNNLSDVASAATSRTNLGLAIGTDVQAYDANLTGFDPADKADTTDARFDAFPISSFVSNTTVTSWGDLYRTDTAATTTLTIPTATAGSVITLYVPASSGAVTIAPDGGVSFYLAGDASTTASFTAAAGAYATITCIDGTDFVVTGAGLS